MENLFDALKRLAPGDFVVVQTGHEKVVDKVIGLSGGSIVLDGGLVFDINTATPTNGGNKKIILRPLTPEIQAEFKEREEAKAEKELRRKESEHEEIIERMLVSFASYGGSFPGFTLEQKELILRFLQALRQPIL